MQNQNQNQNQSKTSSKTTRTRISKTIKIKARTRPKIKIRANNFLFGKRGGKIPPLFFFFVAIQEKILYNRDIKYKTRFQMTELSTRYLAAKR
ncbi:MAG: hypothetical protein IJW22_00895, partial [Clostridia bacterium]|nr:hypothetical protein [Clostridia bacterium]